MLQKIRGESEISGIKKLVKSRSESFQEYTKYKKGDMFNYDVKIVIAYHTFAGKI